MTQYNYIEAEIIDQTTIEVDFGRPIGANWGEIGGNIEDQPDLTALIAAKQDQADALDDIAAITGAETNDVFIRSATGHWVRITLDDFRLLIGVGGTVWGNITGTLANQTDLQNALAAKQPADADLTTIAGLTPADDDVLQRKSGAWTNRTMAQLKVDLGIGSDNANVKNWTTGATYIAGDLVAYQDRLWQAVAGFTAGATFAADLALSRWTPRTIAIWQLNGVYCYPAIVLGADDRFYYADATFTSTDFAAELAAGKWVSIGAGVSGNNKEVQYNDNGSMGADSNLTYDKATKILYAKYLDTDDRSNDITGDAASTRKFPSVKAIKDYADALAAGLLNFRGSYDASGNTWPSTGGSGTGGAVMKGDTWVISVAGTLGGQAVQVGDWVIAIVDAPGQTASNWNILNTNIAYVPEDQANKDTSTSLGTSDTKYPSQNAVKSYIDTGLSGKQEASLNLSSLAALSFSATAFVKMTADGTFQLDTNTYLTSLSGAVLTDQTAGQTIGDTTNRLTKLWATDITVTNAISGSITGNAATVTGLSITAGKTLTVQDNVTITGALGSGAYADISLYATTASLGSGAYATISNYATLATPVFTSYITCGVASGATGSIKLVGTTSGTVTLSVADAAGTWTLKLPTTAGNNLQVLQGDGNGNLSWATISSGIPTVITVANEASDTTCFPAFFTAATGDLAPKTNANFTYNSSTGELGTTLLNGMVCKANNTDYNTYVGFEAGAGMVAGAQYNTFFGYRAGKGGTVTTACDLNTGIGQGALKSLTSGDGNTCVGHNSGTAITSAGSNTCLGANAGVGLTTAGQNTYIGNSCGQSNSTGGSGNVAVGHYAGQNQTGSYSVFIGKSATSFGTGGSSNVVVGAFAYNSGATSNYVVAIGYEALNTASACANSIAIGWKSGKYADGAGQLYIDSYDRSNTAGGKAGAIIYGFMSATASSQTLTFNAATTVTYSLTGTTTITATTGFLPSANDGCALGSTSASFSDLFLATGAVINWNNGNTTLTQSANMLALGTADFQIDDTKAFYIGAAGTDGTWKFIRSGNDLIIQRRESGSYVTKQTITA